MLQKKLLKKPQKQGAKKKLANILQNPTPKKFDAHVKLNQILANEILKKIFFYKYNKHLQHVQK